MWKPLYGFSCFVASRLALDLYFYLAKLGSQSGNCQILLLFPICGERAGVAGVARVVIRTEMDEDTSW